MQTPSVGEVTDILAERLLIRGLNASKLPNAVETVACIAAATTVHNLTDDEMVCTLQAILDTFAEVRRHLLQAQRQTEIVVMGPTSRLQH